MKTIISIIFLFFSTSVYGQTDVFELLLDSAKMEFNKDFEQQDYKKAVEYLQRALISKPNNTEALYFLGYAYSRINSRDGMSMINMSLDLTYKSSEQFEKVNKLTPKYDGEIVILDPYSKISAEWGSMAMSYWHNKKADSSVWAFNEGKKRGGFGKFILELNKCVLDACSENAILISSGDNFSIPLWYLQLVANFRTDVKVIDISLLNTSWYPTFLSNNNSVNFDIPNVVLDTIEYTEWVDTTITIENFSWTVKPSYNNQYLLRGDRILLSLLKENKFQRELYFTIGFNEDNRLSLKDFMKSRVIVDHLSINDKLELNYDDYKKNISKILKLSSHLNLNSEDELRIFDNFRYNLFDNVYNYLTIGDNNKAKELMELLDKLADENKYPFQDENGKKYAEYLRQKL